MGGYTVALGNYNTVIGRYNKATRSGSGTAADPYTYSDTGNYAFIVGNGAGDETARRSNALTVDWSGNLEIAGGLTAKGNSSITGTLGVTGAISGASITTTGAVSAASVTSSGTISATGAISGASLTVSGDITANGTTLKNNPTTTLINNSSGISANSNVTFAEDPKLFDIFTFKVSGQAMTGYASWVSATEIRGMMTWVTSTPNEFFTVIVINNISGKTGKLTTVSHYNKNSNTLDSSVKLINLTGIGAGMGTYADVIHTYHSQTGTLFSESYRYPDGRMDIFIRETVTVAVNNASGNIYYGTANLTNFPVAFTDKPTVTYSSEVGGGNAWVWGRGKQTATNPGGIYLGRGSSTASTTYVINVHACGRWK